MFNGSQEVLRTTEQEGPVGPLRDLLRPFAQGTGVLRHPPEVPLSPDRFSGGSQALLPHFRSSKPPAPSSAFQGAAMPAGAQQVSGSPPRAPLARPGQSAELGRKRGWALIRDPSAPRTLVRDLTG